MDDREEWDSVRIQVGDDEYEALHRGDLFWGGRGLRDVAVPEVGFSLGDRRWRVKRTRAASAPEGGLGIQLIAERTDVPD